RCTERECYDSDHKSLHGCTSPRSRRRKPARYCFFFVSRTASGRFIVLMNSTRRNRSADQSSSIATMRTGSKPAFPITAQPLSRLIWLVYFLDEPFGYATQTTASPL